MTNFASYYYTTHVFLMIGDVKNNENYNGQLTIGVMETERKLSR